MRQLGDTSIAPPEATIASASTTDIASKRSRSVLITGAASINSFGAASNREILLRFTDAATLVHSSSLALPGGVNIKTGPGDTAVATSDGSNNWLLRHYNRAAAEAPWTAYTPVMSGLKGTLAAYTISGAFNVTGKRLEYRSKCAITDKGSSEGPIYYGLPPAFPCRDHTLGVAIEDYNNPPLTLMIQPNQVAAVIRNVNSGSPLVGSTGPWLLIVSGSYEVA